MNKTKKEQPAVKAPDGFDPYEAVIQKYNLAGWEAFRTPGGSAEIMARKTKVKDAQKPAHTKFHFVQVITPETKDEIRFHGESKGNFIQNAFSNSAEPIHAFVTRTRVKNPEATVNPESKWINRIKIKFTNINSNALIRIQKTK